MSDVSGQVEEINIEKIMERVRENIKNKRAAELNVSKGAQAKGPLEENLAQIESNWDPRNHDYRISSHRPLLGGALVKGRQAVHGEVCRYVNPSFEKQMIFNASTAKILRELASRLESTSARLEVLEATAAKVTELEATAAKVTEFGERLDGTISEPRGVEDWVSPLAEEAEHLRSDIMQLRSDMESSVDGKVKAAIAAIEGDVRDRAWLASILNQRISSSLKAPSATSTVTSSADASNYLFEDTYRGPREDIKQRQTAFTHYFQGCRNVLDIGCGRGEFLELMKSQGIGAKGIDIDETMVEYCISRSLDVEIIDAVSYLEKMEEKSLDGIFIDQVVEHLEPDYLTRMLNLCYRKLKYGYYLVVETINPLSLVSFSNYFNMDLSHKKPIHPETLRFLYQFAGFRNVELRLMSPVPEEAKLRKISRDGLEIEGDKAAEVYNYNINLLNNILFAPQDYALVGKK